MGGWGGGGGGKRIVNNFCDLLVLVENFYSLGDKYKKKLDGLL